MSVRFIGYLGAALLGWVTFGQPAAAEVTVPERVRTTRLYLGKLLFFEPALSGNGKRSCASCHRPAKAFTDQRATARAFRLTENLALNTPTLLNAAPQTQFFHDGRAASLAAVTAAVVAHPRELNCSYDTIVARLQTSPGYDSLFRAAFGETISAATLNQALTAYVPPRTPTAPPFDAAQRGGPALEPAALAGWQLFQGEAGCTGCHGGLYFRDDRRHEVAPGVRRRTPTLRNVALTPPYRADGSAPTVSAALTDEFHRAQQPRALTEAEVTALTQFLATLTDTTSADLSTPTTLPWMPHWVDRRVGGQY
ncbi:MAG: c-type cytochrome [Hymenobacteraceae bacterium]|nr:c-type cytochrome [Hymenobacteraceae bacterium]